jgi:hypothetical protein
MRHVHALTALAIIGCSSQEHAPELDMGIPASTDMAVEPALSCSNEMLGDGGVAPSWRNVELIIDNNCNNGMCHYGCRPNLAGNAMDCFLTKGQVGLNLVHGKAYANIVNQIAPDTANQCGGAIVTPGHPEKSYLMVKLTAQNDPVGCNQVIPPDISGLPPGTMACNPFPNGTLMPVTEPLICPLRNCQIDLIRRWILSGAPNSP